MVKYSALAYSMKGKDVKSSASVDLYIQPIILKLLITWLSNCPNAVQCFLDSRPHLTYLFELVSSKTTTSCISGLAAVLLGECIIYNKATDKTKDAYTLVDSISQKIGLTSYFVKFDELKKSFVFSSVKPVETRKPLTRSTAASMAEENEDTENEMSDQKNNESHHPILDSIFDSQFVKFVQNIEGEIRESTVDVYSQPKNNVAVVPAELDQKGGESDGEYINRLKSFVEKQCTEIQDLLNRNSTLAEDLAKTGGDGSARSEPKSGGASDRIQVETLRRDLHETTQRIEILKKEKAKIESEAFHYKTLAGKMESDLKSLSDAYNSLEQSNFHLDQEVKALKSGGAVAVAVAGPDLEEIKERAREEAQKESEAELNDLLVCLGQEQSKVEKLSARLVELGEDVDELLEGIGDEMGANEEVDDEDEED